MNGIIIIDKPEGWTSHDVVAKLRRILGIKRVGHGGTLDPMATGVLPVFVGRGTRAAEFFENFDKEYVAGLRLGITTDTQDTTGTVIRTSAETVTWPQLAEALGRFAGVQEQTPPMYSAVKIGGKKLYELARRGQEVDRASRRITIDSIALEENDIHDDDSGENSAVSGDVKIRVVCSKGTYIRTLCHDIGNALGCGAAMSSLKRTRVGPYTLSDAVTLGDIQEGAQSGALGAMLRPVDTLFDRYPAVTLDDGQKAKSLNGASFPVRLEDGLYRVYDENAVFLMLGRAAEGVMHTVKSFFDV